MSSNMQPLETIEVLTAVTQPGSPRGSGRWARAFRTPLGIASLILLALLVVIAIFAPFFFGHRAVESDLDAISMGPSKMHWAGTDALGRDLLARVFVATRFSLGLALLSTAIGVSLGVLLGSLPWLGGRWVGRLAAGFVNVAIAFPSLLLALFFAVVFGVGTKGAVLAIGFSMAPWFGRLTQTLVAGIQERDFISAALIAGDSRMRILRRHILPNVGEPLVVNATLAAGGALLSFAGLSFLGLGVQSPKYDWGLLLNDGLDGIYVNPLGALAPGIAIVVAGLAFNLAGETIAKELGLRTSQRSSPVVEPSRELHPVEVSSADDSDLVLSVEKLQVTAPNDQGTVHLVRDATFVIHRGEKVGVLGESGSGKSLTALALAGLVEAPLQVQSTRLSFLGHDISLQGDTGPTRRRLLGENLGFVFQDPSTSFNPTMRVGDQLAEVAREHRGFSRSKARSRAIDRLRDVQVPAAKRRARQYPHEFSGGMRQRAMIAMAMMGRPALILADEPTTALDVTVQRGILRLLNRVQSDHDVAVLLISHDVTVVRQFCDRVLVMYAGRVVEDLPANRLVGGARHPYTQALIDAVPDMRSDRDKPLPAISGRPISPSEVGVGCAFAARCKFATEKCSEVDPPLEEVDEHGQLAACWHPIAHGDGASGLDTRGAATK